MNLESYKRLYNVYHGKFDILKKCYIYIHLVIQIYDIVSQIFRKLHKYKLM